MISSLLVVRRNKQEELFTHKEEMALMALSDSKVLKNSKNLRLLSMVLGILVLKPTTGYDKESDNSKENTDDSLEQHQITDTKTSSFESPLKVDKDLKEKFFYPANHVESVNKIEKPVRKNNDAPIIKDWVSDDEEQDGSKTRPKKKTVISTAAKIENPVRKPMKYAEM
ncbi:hypothetical protein Tco_0156353 [Tanacetum coccineum]